MKVINNKILFIIFIIIFFIIVIIFTNKKRKKEYYGYISDCIDSNTFLLQTNDNKYIKFRPTFYEVYESKISNKAYKQAKKFNLSVDEIIKKGESALKYCKKYIENDIDGDGKKYKYTFICYNKYDEYGRMFCDFENKDFLYVILSLYNDEKENYTIEIDNSWIQYYK